MKIIFNHSIDDWYWQIYDEWNRNHDVVLPEKYNEKGFNKNFIDLIHLEKCYKKNSNYDLIFGFRGRLDAFLKWKRFKINIPIICLKTNAINRRHVARCSIFAKLWYVENYAKPLMEEYNIENLFYEGMAANPYIFFPLKTEKLYDIGFIGQHYGERKYFLNFIKDFCLNTNLTYKFPLSHGRFVPLSFKQINLYYNQTKINISFAPKEPSGRIINLRTFEICMSGNFQLMQYTPIIEHFFEIDKEIVCWNNKKDLIEKISYYLENKDEREKIAKNGYKRAIENHTWSKRIEQIWFRINKQKRKDISNFRISLDRILEKKKIDELQKKYINKSIPTSILLSLILKKYGYKVNHDLRTKNSIRIILRNRIFFYKPNLKNYFFIRMYNRIIMVIKVVSSKSKINWNDWDDLKEILYLNENWDYTIPQFGFIFNESEIIIHDFKNRKWLSNIPNRKSVKASMNLNYYLLIKIIEIIRGIYISYNFAKLTFSTRFNALLIFFYNKLIIRIIKMIKNV